MDRALRARVCVHAALSPPRVCALRAHSWSVLCLVCIFFPFQLAGQIPSLTLTAPAVFSQAGYVQSLAVGKVFGRALPDVVLSVGDTGLVVSGKTSATQVRCCWASVGYWALRVKALCFLGRW